MNAMTSTIGLQREERGGKTNAMSLATRTSCTLFSILIKTKLNCKECETIIAQKSVNKQISTVREVLDRVTTRRIRFTYQRISLPNFDLQILERHYM